MSGFGLLCFLQHQHNHISALHLRCTMDNKHTKPPLRGCGVLEASCQQWGQPPAPFSRAHDLLLLPSTLVVLGAARTEPTKPGKFTENYLFALFLLPG